MPWIGDVAPYDTIQSLWGNTIRDHTPAVFTNIAERNANATKMIEGQMCVCVAERATYVRRLSAANGFSTVFDDWQNYTIAYQLDPGFPNSITQYVGRYRRLGGRTVEANMTFVINQNYSSAGYMLLWTLPVRALQLDMVIGGGEGYDSNKYCIGPVKTHATDGLWCYITDQATRLQYKPFTGTPTVRVSVLYEVDDG